MSVSVKKTMLLLTIALIAPSKAENATALNVTLMTCDIVALLPKMIMLQTIANSGSMAANAQMGSLPTMLVSTRSRSAAQAPATRSATMGIQFKRIVSLNIQKENAIH